MAGARLDRDRGRACSWRCPGSASGCRCRRSAAPSACSSSSSWRWRRPCRCSRSAGRARSKACAGSTATACCRIGRPPRSPTAWRPRPAISSRSRCGARIWSGRCAPRDRSRPASPSPQVAARDPYALRGAGARCSRSRRSLPPAAIASSASPRRSTGTAWCTPANYRIDAWVTPPAYTGRPPLILPGLRPGEQAQARGSGPVTVPAGSTLVVRSTGQSGLDVAVKGGIEEAKADSQAAGAQGHRGAPLHHHRRRHRHRQGRQRRRELDLQRHPGSRADHRARQGAGAPASRLAAAATTRSRTTTAWSTRRRPSSASRLRGQARRVAGRGEAAASAVRRAQLHAGAAAGAHPRRRRPDHQGSVRASLGRRRCDDDAGRPRRGQQRGPLDAARDAAAGAAVRQALAARADRAAPRSCARRQRQGPRADGARRARPSRRSASSRRPTSISGCARSTGSWRAPRATTACATWWRGCGRWRCSSRTATSRRPRSSFAPRRTRLREALERGASDEEIKKLMDELRAALDKFMQALAEELRKNPQMARPLDPNSMRQLRSQDLRSMLDRMERLARSGAKDAAKQIARSAPRRCWTTCRWRSRTATWATATTCSRRSTSSAT